MIFLPNLPKCGIFAQIYLILLSYVYLTALIYGDIHLPCDREVVKHQLRERSTQWNISWANGAAVELQLRERGRQWNIS